MDQHHTSAPGQAGPQGDTSGALPPLPPGRIRTVVTGIGLLTPVGLSTDESFENLYKGVSGARTIDLFDASGHSTHFACQLPKGYADLEKKHASRRFGRQTVRHTRIGFIAVKQMLERYPVDVSSLNRRKLAVSLGVSGAGVDGDKNDQWEIVKSMVNALPAWISIELGFEGPSFAVATACASSADAIAHAWRLIQTGEADLVITGGADAPITDRVLSGFSHLMALSSRNDAPDKASRPFDAGRDGFVLGEGAGVLILESEAHARARGASILAELRGFAASSEANNIMAPKEGGEGMAITMRDAIQHAGLTPDQIDYVSAHGTSTQHNDLSEGLAMRLVFGDRYRQVPISSQKSMVGHSIGAAGGVEAVTTILSLMHQKLTPTLNQDALDPRLEGLDTVPNQGREATLQHALSNSFAFGGHNCSLVFSRV